MFLLNLIATVILIYPVISIPIDLFTTDVVRPLDSRITKTGSGPGICKENLNNDNITNIKWYRYHNETHKCWHIDERGPCGRMMLFYAIDDSEYGDCDCNFYYRCARPLIYWPTANRCYYINDQGPCGSHEWLVLTETQQPSCQLNPCKYNQTTEPSTYDRYWFEEEGHCYMTLSQGYCKNSQEVLYSKWDDYKPSCNVGRVCNSRNVRSSYGAMAQCIPGQKSDQFGNCRPPVRYSNWFPFFR